MSHQAGNEPHLPGLAPYGPYAPLRPKKPWRAPLIILPAIDTTTAKGPFHSEITTNYFNGGPSS